MNCKLFNWQTTLNTDRARIRASMCKRKITRFFFLSIICSIAWQPNVFLAFFVNSRYVDLIWFGFLCLSHLYVPCLLCHLFYLHQSLSRTLAPSPLKCSHCLDFKYFADNWMYVCQWASVYFLSQNNFNYTL